MVTDPIFYRLFETSPETFFLLLGMSTESAKAMAARYQYQAIEFKETSHRVDGVFLPKEAGLPLVFLQPTDHLPSVFADLFPYPEKALATYPFELSGGCASAP